MQLKEYLVKNDLKPTPWSVKNKISPAVISRYLRGSGISKENALKIQIATNNVVTAIEVLYPPNNQ